MTTYFVSPSGVSGNPGTFEEPFATVQAGVQSLVAGDELLIREGTYVGAVRITGREGSASSPIVIRPFELEHVVIDASEPEFRSAPNGDWVLARLTDPLAHEHEYISDKTFPVSGLGSRPSRGAFLDREAYTRLITYSQLADLRVDNQGFDDLDVGHELEGRVVTDADGNPILRNGEPFKRPLVYMGPGIFFNGETGKVHIRLSHTSNNVLGIEDYDGATDPTQVRLAISSESRPALLVRNSKFVRLENLMIRFGGINTVTIEGSKDVTLDHVRICAASHGVHIAAGNERTVLRHCEVQGGIPPWFFRSDIKDGYQFKDGDTVRDNTLGRSTSTALLHGSADNMDTLIESCEFRDGHDMALVGVRTTFRNNWVDNLNDEALILDGDEVHDLHVVRNAITRSLAALSFAGDQVGGRIFVYRNLIDLRSATVGRRPKPPPPDGVPDEAEVREHVFRFGTLWKGGDEDPDGPLDLFHNTCLVHDQRVQASYVHHKRDPSIEPVAPWRSFNSVFVVVNPVPSADHSISFVPSPSFPGDTDGNCYFRLGLFTQPLLRFGPYKFQGTDFPGGSFDDLVALRASTLFDQSKSQYAPGYEAVSIADDPSFRRLAADGRPRFDDDLRLGDVSPAKDAGIKLPDELRLHDEVVTGPLTQPPDIGCFVFDTAPLSVGVDGRRQFPSP